MKFRLITFVFLALFISCTRKEEVDIVVLNGQIYSVDSSFNIWEAMAIKNGRVVAVGASADIKERFIAKENIDATGKAIYPGFIDAHCHFTGMATDQWKCNLFGTQSFREVLDTITAYAKNANTTWIYGRGWDQNDWESKTYPTKKELDSLFPHQPVFLKRVDGHAALVNQAALNFAGITTSTKTEGGIFETKDGKLTGILIDRAMEMVDEKIPGIPDSLALEYYDNIQRLCFAVGLTSVQDCGISEHTLGLLERFEKEGRMRIKVFALLSDSVHYYDKWVAKGVFRSPLITMGGFKVYADGALGSRGGMLTSAILRSTRLERFHAKGFGIFFYGGK